MIAGSPADGLGWPAGSVPRESRSFQLSRPSGAGPVRRSRDSRAFFTGRRSARRLTNGSSAVTSIATMWRTPFSCARSTSIGLILSHAMTTSASWSSNGARSSPIV